MMSQTALLSRTLKSYFSTIPSHLKDWEYISKIEQNLKHNNIGEAAKYLINVFNFVCRAASIVRCLMSTFLEASI